MNLTNFYNYTKRLIQLAQASEKHSKDIEALREEIKELAEAVRDLKYAQQRAEEKAEHERENLLLRLENTLLRFERRFAQNAPSSGEAADAQNEDVRLIENKHTEKNSPTSAPIGDHEEEAHREEGD